MSARRMLELEQDGNVLRWRTPWGSPVTKQGEIVLVLSVEAARDYVMTGDDVEKLHQLTYEILAGRARDPRLDRLDDVVDASIMCGAFAGDLECALHDGHKPLVLEGPTRVGDFHVTPDGTYFQDVPRPGPCGVTDGVWTCDLEAGHGPLQLPTREAHGMHVTRTGVVFVEIPF
jgi:hypothetical protein